MAAAAIMTPVGWTDSQAPPMTLDANRNHKKASEPSLKSQPPITMRRRIGGIHWMRLSQWRQTMIPAPAQKGVNRRPSAPEKAFVQFGHASTTATTISSFHGIAAPTNPSRSRTR